MSRLRRLQVTGKTFFITCNLLRVRTQLAEADFEALASAVVRVHARRGFLFTGYVFMPDHWHALIIPREGDALPNLMDAVKVASTLGINRSRRAVRRKGKARFRMTRIRYPPLSIHASKPRLALDESLMPRRNARYGPMRCRAGKASRGTAPVVPDSAHRRTAVEKTVRPGSDGESQDRAVPSKRE
jgi:REP element-mobilizing transposase RayT